jgi:pSer/pThr/pTyr-binding forkhead associated (FHA) protein
VGVLRKVGGDKSFTLGSRCLLGRHPGCDLRVDNPRVSGEHASLRWIGDHWEVRDLGSKNGTIVDGARLGGGKRAILVQGSVITLGGEEAFVLEDAAPPVASARHAQTFRLRTATDGLLVLPDDDHPEMSILEDANGRWVAEDSEGARYVVDRDLVVVDGEGWILDLPHVTIATHEVNDVPPSIEGVSLRFGVSRDEEHIEVTVVDGARTTSLPPRSHHYLLLTLARALLEDPESSPAERGWVDRAVLCRMLATPPNLLNVAVFRAGSSRSTASRAPRASSRAGRARDSCGSGRIGSR